MFDRIEIAPARNVYHSTTITEQRAPTDESVRLLKEMEQAARDKVLESVRVENCPIDCVLHTMRDPISDQFHVLAIFKVNGKKAEVRREFNMYSLTSEDVAMQMHKAVAEKIAADMLNKAFAVATDKLGDFK